jgi:class 3 adenylate cyclase
MEASLSDITLTPSGPTAPSAERRQITVVFADMVGFTAISERLGEEGTYALIQPIYELMAGAVREQGGSVKDFTGDGIMALFGAPNALEDAPLRACRAGLLIHERLAAAAPAIEAKYGMRPKMRIGINTGLAVVTQIRGESANMTALGDTVNLASRLQALAEPGTVLLSEATHRLVQGLVETSFTGAHSIKGKAEPQKTWRLDSIRQGATRFEAALGRGLNAYVGRERELEILERGLAEARSQLCVIDLMAEPGMGKSRLLHEFRQRIGKERAFVLAGNCSPDGQRTPFLPFIEVIRGSFRVAAGEAEAAMAHKLDNGLKVLGLATPQNLGLLLNLLGLKPPEGALQGLDGTLIGLRTRDLLQQLLQARCQLSPVVMIFEDMQWIDSASEELLGKFVETEDRLPLLILHTRRPEYQPPWAERPKVRLLPLEPLSAREISRIVEAQLGADMLPQALARIVSDKAEGNALFAEELASFLLERGLVSRTTDGPEFDVEALTNELPASVLSLLTSRVDRLSPTDRALLQAAAVIGRCFDPDLLAVVASASDDIEARLAAMQPFDLVHRNSKSADYVFKHALVREALYGSLLSARRTALHQKIAEEIERRSGNRLVEVAEMLAHHYGLTACADKAFLFLAMAGKKSLDVYTLDEAEGYLRQALKLRERTPECASDQATADAVVNLLQAIFFKSDFLEIKRLAQRYVPWLETLGDTPQLAVALYFSGVALAHGYDFEQFDLTCKRVIDIAERIGDVRARAYGLNGVMWASIVLARNPRAAAERIGIEFLSNSRKAGDNYVLNWAYWCIAWDYMYRGLFSEAREWVWKLMDAGRERNDRRALGLAHWTLGFINLSDGHYDEAARNGVDCLQTAVTPLDRSLGAVLKATSAIFLGDVEQGLPQLIELRRRQLDLGRVYIASSMDGAVGVGLVLARRIKAGIRSLQIDVAEVDTRGDCTNATLKRLSLAEVYLEMLGSRTVPTNSDHPPESGRDHWREVLRRPKDRDAA